MLIISAVKICKQFCKLLQLPDPLPGFAPGPHWRLPSPDALKPPVGRISYS